MKVVVVFNPQSGSSLERDELEKRFTRAEVEVVAYIDATHSLHDELKSYTRQDDTIIVGYGGDGTLRSIAAELVHTKAIFAPLAGGTLNHFTKDLGVDQDLDTAINHLKSAKVKEIDTVSVNDATFINNSSIGLYPISLIERTKLEDRLGKWPAAVIASIRAFVRFKLYTITIEGEKFLTPFVFIGNNHYDIDALLTRSSLSDGTMSIYAIDSTKRSALLKIVVLSLVGRPSRAPELKSYKSTAVAIEIQRRFVRVSYDGEQVKLKPPLKYVLHKKSLRVLA